jgi:Cu/Ag efflux protein CusF
VNVRSGVGTALENDQAVATLVGKIAQQVTITAGRLKKLVAKANRVTLEEG